MPTSKTTEEQLLIVEHVLQQEVEGEEHQKDILVLVEEDINVQKADPWPACHVTIEKTIQEDFLSSSSYHRDYCDMGTSQWMGEIDFYELEASCLSNESSSPYEEHLL